MELRKQRGRKGSRARQRGKKHGSGGWRMLSEKGMGGFAGEVVRRCWSFQVDVVCIERSSAPTSNSR